MDFDLSSKQRALIARFRDWAEGTFTPNLVRVWCRDQGVPDDVARGFSQLYFSCGESLGSGHGSSMYSLLDQALILEELSSQAAATLPFQIDMFNLSIYGHFADSKGFAEAIEGYRATGRLMFAFAVSEPQAGSDTMNMQTTVQTIDGTLWLNGKKTYVNNGEYAPYILVAAIDRDDTEPRKYPSLSFWFIPRTLEGISAVPIPKIGQPMLPFADLSFNDVELKPEYRLSGYDIDRGFQELFAMLEYGRVFACATSVGLAQAAMRDAARHAASRRAFGQKIGQFQQIAEILTDMEIRLSNMRSLLYRAAWEVDHNQPDKQLTVALMKRSIPSEATKVASDAMQILGGYGYTESSRVSGIWRDCRGNQLAEGTDQIMVYIAGPLILSKYE